jgi:hypothetical protein
MSRVRNGSSNKVQHISSLTRVQKHYSSRLTKLTAWSRILEKLTVHSASQDIPHLLWNPNVHYHVNKSQSLIPILRKVNVVYAHTPYFFKIILILSSHLRLGLPSGSFFRFSDSDFLCVSHLFHACYISPFFDLVTRIIFGGENQL